MLHSYSVAEIFNVQNGSSENTDLVVGRLDTPIPSADDVGFYPLLDLITEVNYVGQSLAVYGKTARAGSGTIAAFSDFGGDPITGGTGINSTRSYQFNYTKAAGDGDDAHGEGGDSGSPSFVLHEGELALTGIHTAILDTALTVATYDTFLAHDPYVDQMNAFLAESGYQLQTVPEPSSYALFAGVGFLCLALLRRRL